MEIDISSFVYAALYLGGGFVLMILYLQFRWAKTCARNIMVLVQRTSGGGDFLLAPKTGGSVTIQPNITDAQGNLVPSKMFVLNELSTIEVPYPGVGFIPQALQKSIRMIVVDENDWEPITNRSPGRAMVGSPEFLSNIINERVSGLAIAVSKDVFDPLTKLMKNLSQLPRASYVYIGLGLVLIICAIMVFRVMPLSTDVANNAADLQLIKQALGIPVTPVVP